MLIDITLTVTPDMVANAQGNEKKSLVGHIGTHFDVMNKEFPLEYVEREGIVFDVSNIVLKKVYLSLKIYVILKRFFKNKKVRFSKRILIL